MKFAEQREKKNEHKHLSTNVRLIPRPVLQKDKNYSHQNFEKAQNCRMNLCHRI